MLVEISGNQKIIIKLLEENSLINHRECGTNLLQEDFISNKQINKKSRLHCLNSKRVNISDSGRIQKMAIRTSVWFCQLGRRMRQI